MNFPERILKCVYRTSSGRDKRQEVKAETKGERPAEEAEKPSLVLHPFMKLLPCTPL